VRYKPYSATEFTSFAGFKLSDAIDPMKGDTYRFGNHLNSNGF